MWRWIVLSLVLAATGFLQPAASRAAAVVAQSPAWLSGWPMDGHDAQHTYRSPVAGPQHPHPLFARKGAIVLLTGADGRMYGLVTRGHTFVPARFSASGRLQITYAHPTGAPSALLPNGDVALGGGDNGTFALYRPNGKAAWRRTDVGFPKGSTPVVSLDSLLYVPFLGHPDDNTSGLDVFQTNGQRQRIEPGLPFFAVALAPSGAIYALTYNQASGESDLQALDPAGDLSWQHRFTTSLEASGGCRCLAVAPDGGVYTTDGDTLQAYTPSGDLRWSRQETDGVLALAERADGSLLVAGRSRLEALSASGAILWSAALGTHAQSAVLPSLVVDSAGTAYIGTTNGHVLIISASGTRLARLNAGPNRSGIAPTCLLDARGRLIVDGADGTLRVYVESK